MGSHLELVTPPAVEPVTLDEVKSYCKVEHTADDPLLTGLITAARQRVEHRLTRCLISTEWDLFLDGFPYGGGYYNREIRQAGPPPGNPDWLPGGFGPIVLMRAPLLEVVSLDYRDSTGALVTMDPSLYQVSKGTPGRIVPAYGVIWPTVAPVLDAVRIRYKAGYGDTPESVPEICRTSILVYVLDLYDNRGSFVTGTIVAELPTAVENLLASQEWGPYLPLN